MVAASLAMRWSLSDVWNNARYLEIESGLFTFILIVGATLEYWPHLKQLAFQTLKVLRFWRTLPYERPVWKKLAFHAVAPLLVVIGIAGELVFETRTFIVEDLETTSLSQEVKDAKTAADGAETDAGHAHVLAQSASDIAGAAKLKADAADVAAGNAQQTIKLIGKEVNALSPRMLTAEQESKIADALRGVSRFPYPTLIESYGMDGEGTALATQLISTLTATGYGSPGDGRSDKIVSGGFEWGISIRGPAYEMPYMTALRDALMNIGRLQQVSINGPSPRVGAQISGTASISGKAAMSGGGGPPVQLPIPTQGPVTVMVGIRPPIVLPASGKQQ
jgi:hypothetical protein